MKEKTVREFKECYVVFKSNPDAQFKTFKNVTAFTEWCARNSEKIVKVNGIVTDGVVLSEEDSYKITKSEVPECVIKSRAAAKEAKAAEKTA